MDFLTQAQKIAKCKVCKKEFLAIGDMNSEEEYFCSADCTEKYMEMKDR